MTYVDEEIVRLQFDNKQFEQETAQSMSTLDKLKEKLSFKNASNGAEQLNRAVTSINVNPVIQGLDTIETRMSALGVAGKRIVENLVDWAMAGVSSLVSKLEAPINQVIQGGKTRAQNIEQAKFQLEGLGVAWSDIEEDISYGVQDTAYGLDSAAKVASQLVASQVELGDEMKHALLGISGVAAMTNSSYDDIGRIYTTVAGNGRLMGEQLLQLSSRGINAAATLGKALGKTEADIRDMVSKGQISFEMFSDAMFTAFGTHAKEANKTFSGALSNTKAALSRLGADVAAQGFNSIRDILNEVIPKLKDLKKALKPVEDSIIHMIDSVGKLIETFVKSINISSIVDFIAPKIQKVADTIAEFAEAYNMIFNEKSVKNTTAFLEEQKGLKRLEDQAKDTTTTLADLSKITDEQKEKARLIWEEGAFGTGQDRVEALGNDYKMVQGYLDAMIEAGWDEEKLNEQITKSVEEETKAEKDWIKLNKRRETIETLKKVLNNLKHVATNVFNSLRNVFTVLSDSFSRAFNAKNVTGGIINFTGYLAEISDKLFITGDRAKKLSPIFDAFFTIVKWGGKLLISAVKGISMLITKIAELINRLRESETVKNFIETMKDSFDKFVQLIKDSYNKIKDSGVFDLISDGFKKILEFISVVLPMGVNALSTIVGGVIDGVTTGIGGLIEAASKFFGYIVEGIRGPLTSMFNLIKDIIGAISLRSVLKAGGIMVIVQVIMIIYSLMATVFRIINGLGKFADGIGKFIQSLGEMFEAKVRRMNVETFVLFVEAVTKIIWAIVALTLVMALIPNADKMAWQAFAIVGIITLLYGAIDLIGKKIVNSTTRLGNINITLANAKMQMGIFFVGVAAMLASVISAIKSIYNITSSKDYNSDAFLKSIFLIVGIVAGLTAMMMALIDRSAGRGKSKPIFRLALLILSFAASIKIIISALGDLYELVKTKSDMGRFTQISAIIFALFGVIIILIYMLGKMRKIKNMTALSVLLLSYSVALKIVIDAVGEILKTANEMESTNKFWNAIGGVALIVGELGLLIIAMMGLMQLGEKRRLKLSTLTGLSLLVISMGVMVKSIVPAIESVAKVYKELGADKASDALWGLIRIVGIVGLLAVAIEGLTMLGKGTSIISLVGISLVLLALGSVIKNIAKTLSALSDVENLDGLIKFTTVIGIVIGALVLLSGILGIIAGPTGAAAILAIAGVIVSVGLSVYLAAQGFKTLQEALQNFVDYLPTVIDKLLEFFNSIHDHKDELVEGITETVGFMFEGFNAAITEWLTDLKTYLPLWIEALLDAFIELCNGFASAVVRKGPGVVDAVDNAATAMLYFASLVVEKFQEKGKALFKSIIPWIGKQISPHNETLQKGWGEAFGTDTTATLVDPKALEQQTKQAVEEGTKAGEATAKNFYENYYKSAADKARDYDSSESKESFFKSLINTDELPDWAKNIVGNDIDNIDGTYLKTKFVEKIGIGDITSEDLANAINLGDTSKISEAIGHQIDDDTFANMFEGIDWEAEDATEQALERINNFDMESNDILSNWATNTEDTGELAFDNLASGMEAKKEVVIKVCGEIQEDALEKIYEYEPSFYIAGKMCAQGYADGLNADDAKEKTYNNISELVLDTRNKLAETARIKSPSKVFEELGRYVVLGFAQGITNLSYAAEEATEGVGEESMNALQMILNRLFDTTIENMDTNPTITPVLDLSQLEEGIGSMNGMLDNNSSFGLAFGNASSYNNGLSAKFAGMKVQNEYDGTNVVEAVNSLRTDINEIKAEITTLGFYVDGKQMATAIADPMSSALNKIAVNTGRGVK